MLVYLLSLSVPHLPTFLSFARWALVQSQNSKRTPPSFHPNPSRPIPIPSHTHPIIPSSCFSTTSSLLSLPAKASELGTTPPASFVVRESDLNLPPPAPTSPHFSDLHPPSLHPPPRLLLSLFTLNTNFLFTTHTRFPLIISLNRSLSSSIFACDPDLS
ncbi:uncharacterized protein LY79DRAFT_37301 [Colletotrichum navitas]|uniref:Uncharacterized protein n=1 Tax=Colletotrichum navitas TaxID=681940 RepID=A0AAD8V960_9PEZI|nr:uncharacterized protein LY79DRAFT_37301 [Colletotrichum navitas]KAK1596973.1 hypothetical protein LY79DRAFT_37301 [Colletotrichum navitas]